MRPASVYMDRRGIQKRQDGVLCHRSCAMVTYLLTLSSHKPFFLTSASSPCDAMSAVGELPGRTAINGSKASSDSLPVRKDKAVCKLHVKADNNQS